MKKVITMLFVILSSVFLFSFVFANSTANSTTSSSSSNGGGGDSECKNGVKLNTNIPGIGKCIKQEESGSAFSTLMTKLMKLLLNITVSVALIAFIVAGIMMMVSGVSQSTAGKGKELIKKVVIGIILLGLSGIILHTLNPNFFKTSIDYQIIKKLKV